MVIPLSRSRSHIIQQLVLHVAALNGMSEFQKTISQGALAMIDVGYYTKVADILHCLKDAKIDIYCH